MAQHERSSIKRYALTFSKTLVLHHLIVLHHVIHYLNLLEKYNDFKKKKKSRCFPLLHRVLSSTSFLLPPCEIVGVGVGVGEEDTNQQEDNLINKNNPSDFGVQEASFGENILDFEARERWVFLLLLLHLFSFYLNLRCL